LKHLAAIGGLWVRLPAVLARFDRFLGRLLEVQARVEERVTAPRRIVELERDLGARMVLSSLSQIENCLELFFHFETFIARLPGL